ncbi:MAG: zinc metalloprotease HtpX [Pseudomonadales bacterium]|nr:zinc metalloprotease HtpX [Pseudomonadales bacterium]
MPLKESTLRQINLKNQIQTIGLLLLMGLFSWLLGSWIFGPDFAIIAVIVGVIGLVMNPAISPKMLMKAYGASVIGYQQSPELYQINQVLSQRASLPQPPTLYYVPVGTMNAFATGNQKNAAIGLSQGLLQQLTLEEIAGVLAHEISHIRYNDMRVMTLAETLGNLTRTLSIVGQLTLLFSIPMMLTGMVQINLLPLLLLIFAPTLAALIQLAISRRREYHADISSAELLGTPEPLMKALTKLDRQNSYWERFYRASSDNSLLRTHPKTAERIAQLKEVYQAEPPRTFSQLPFPGFQAQSQRSPWHTASHRMHPRRVSRYFWF